MSTTFEDDLAPRSESANYPARSERIGESPYLVNVLSKRQQLQLVLLIAGWVCGLVVFYTWWFHSSHIVGVFRFGLNTLLVTWTSIVPAYLFFFTLQMKRVNPTLVIPESWRVAMVTTRAPSEPFEVVKETLLAMLAQSHPHFEFLFALANHRGFAAFKRGKHGLRHG